MAKLRSFDDIGKATGAETALSLVGAGGKKAGPDDFLNRLNATIGLTREMFKEIKESGLAGRQGPQKQQSELVNLVQILVKVGLGDTPIGQLLKMVEGKTLKDLIGGMGNVRPDE